ncbi:hypothetical protein C8J56DRAFT_1011188 [Mycena floridula]|nr:hypothetical protein C8J56DRAFT_1011188 [Mycena floridula]
MRHCKHCHEWRNIRLFDRHETSCRNKIKMLKAQREFLLGGKAPAPAIQIRDLGSPMRTCSPTQPDLWMDMDIEFKDCVTEVIEGPRLPDLYVKVVPHPHSPEFPTVTPLTGTNSNPALSEYDPKKSEQPWAPFRSMADFEFTESAIQGLLSKKLVDKMLTGIHGSWSAHKSTLSIHNHSEMEAVLVSARQYFKKAHIEVTYQGQPQSFDFSYRDPWEVMVALASDPSLAPHSTWHSARKFMCRGGVIAEELERLFDEPFTGDEWWETDSALPDIKKDSYTHCYMPVHIWLDKGNVTTKVKKHPMLLRAAWLPSKIRNASGNEGGVLLTYVPIVTDPGAPDERTEQEKYDFQQFKKEVYQSVVQVVNGDTFKFGDGKVRVGHPGIEIESMDGEEIAHWTGVRAATAQHPCPKCLVDKCDLHRLSSKSTMRTTSLMRDALTRARSAPNKTARGKILQDFGMHDFKNSDPYSAASYDWGKHLWPLLLRVLEELKASERFNANMANFPQWPKLKHFSAVTNIEYSDGQAFFDILKDVSVRHKKNFDFFKQHWTSHVVEDIRKKGSTVNTTTRPGEGFQQEAAQAYKQTNGRNAEDQMSRIDENQEAIASIRMNIDYCAEARERELELELEWQTRGDSETGLTGEDFEERPENDRQWTLKAPQRVTNSNLLEAAYSGNLAYKDFDLRLRGFVAQNFSHMCATYEEVIKIYPFNSLEARDLLRCNSNWNSKGPRADSVLIHAEGDSLLPARLVKVFRCKFMGSGRTLDLALVRMFTPERKWKPRTIWDGCQIFSEGKESTFVSMEYITRGALLAPAKRAGIYTLVDCTDYDMFLRANRYD